ncbi:MAG: NUDIX domain-containing protein [Candidatus Thorarchaeota archaeon]|jgi:8-oxo-dGTP diphosphatase
MYKNPASAVDVSIIQEGKLILIERGREPFKGRWAFPGGFVDYGESVEDAAKREVMEETGLEIKLLEILGIYSAPDRDPRKHVITSHFIAKPVGGNLEGGDDASDAKWFDISSIRSDDLAFDHGQALNDLRNWLDTKCRTYWSGKTR